MHALLPLDRHPHLFADVFIDDCEFSNQSDPHAPRPDAVRSLQASIRDFAVQLSKFTHNSKLPGRVRIRTMTEFFGEVGFDYNYMGTELMALLLRSRVVLHETFNQILSNNRVKTCAVRPICPDCGLGRRSTTVTRQSGFQISTECRTYDCDTGRYLVDPEAGHTNWAVYYAVVSLMNLLVTRQYSSDALEVLGGDYGLEWGPKDRPIAERLEESVRRIRQPDSPRLEYFVGQLLCNDEGRKVSKSHGDSSAEPPDFEALLQMMQDRETVLVRPK
jgi:hypothetical protein